MKNIFTVDLEDWYQGIGKDRSCWDSYERRLRVGFDKLMNLLDKKNVKATFFILGKILEDHPDVIKEIIGEGHELGCHTYSHQAIYATTPESFDEDINKCVSILKDNFNSTFTGFRAPYFSIDNRCLWALDILSKYGFIYDSSIYPGDNKRTGIVGYRKDIHKLENNLWEAPLTTFKFFKYEVGFGGAYFRILPYQFFKYRLNQLNKIKIPGIFYVHPWELDPHHPYISDLPSRIKYPHYFNLGSTSRRIERLLDDFDFDSFSKVILN
jgi:polysaccharide deacetylase family protein (PEP-CTERM system associated)